MADHIVKKITTEVLEDNTPVFRVNIQRPDGSTIDHIMPTAILAIRAGEYGMDPVNDRDSIVDMVLHEPYMDVVSNAQLKRDSLPGAKRQAGDMIHLFNADTVADARAAHLARVEEVKKHTNVVWTTKAKGQSAIAADDPGKLFHDFQIDAQMVRQHADRIMQARGKLGKEQLPQAEPNPRYARPYDNSVRRRGVTVALLDT